MTARFAASGTASGKIAILLLGGSVLALIGISAVSAMRGEALGGVAFGLIVATVLMIPALILACWVPQIRSAAKAVWLAYCGITLVLVVTAAEYGGTKDMDIVITTLITILAFPIGIVVAVAGSVMFGLLSALVASIVLWAIAVGLGYWQWFVLLPAIVRGRRLDNSAT